MKRITLSYTFEIKDPKKMKEAYLSLPPGEPAFSAADVENIHITNVLADMMLIIDMVTLHTYAGGGDPRGDEPDGQTGGKVGGPGRNR